MRPATLVALLVALLLGGLAAYMVRGLVQNQGSVPVEQAAAKTTIVVAAQALPYGAALTPESATEVEWPPGNIPEGAFATKQELFKDGRRVVLAPLQRNEPILNSKVTGPNQRAVLSTLLEEGMRAVTVRVDEVRGVAGFVRPTDRVDVVLTRGETGADQTKAFADVLLQNIKVLAIDQKVSDDEKTGAGAARAVTLELDVEGSQKVILAQSIGRLSLVLRQPGEVGSRAARRVTVGDLGPPEQTRAEAYELVRPVVAPTPPPVRDATVVVNVTRGIKREPYSVASERNGEVRVEAHAQ